MLGQLIPEVGHIFGHFRDFETWAWGGRFSGWGTSTGPDLSPVGFSVCPYLCTFSTSGSEIMLLPSFYAFVQVQPSAWRAFSASFSLVHLQDQAQGFPPKGGPNL